jgi:uncharacterized iron-regulated membrane protein
MALTDSVDHRQISSSKSLYARVWRWHFYAGLYVAPFVIMLSVTGLVQLSKGQLDAWLYADRIFVPTPGPARLSIDEQLHAVGRAFPDRTLVQVTPAFDVARSAEVLTTKDGVNAAVFVDPTSGVVLGDVYDSRRPGVVALLVHGTLLAGRLGDWLIEIAAGLGVVLVVSGLYMWWPRSGWTSALKIARAPRRLVMRDLHKMVGIVLAPVFVFYLITGLTWTEVWGERFTQAWSTFPAERSAPAGATSSDSHAAPTHGDVLNSPGRQGAPWGIEQTPVPASHQHNNHGSPQTGDVSSRRVNADQAIAVAQEHGIGERFIVRVPVGASGVWTISATGMSGLITDARDELTVHVDQYSGEVRGVIGFSDYSLAAKAMAVSVPLHQGSFGVWNVLTAAFVCLAVLALVITGLLTWWWRRPAKVWRLAAPPLPHGMPPPRVALTTAIVIGLSFPLVGVTFLTLAVFDSLIVQRIPKLRAVLE